MENHLLYMVIMPVALPKEILKSATQKFFIYIHMFGP